MRKAKLTVCVGIAMLLGVASTAAAGVVYPDPAGGWAYTYTGDGALAGINGEFDHNSDNDAFDALDGTWGHTNDSDTWNGSYSAANGGVRSQSGYLTMVDKNPGGATNEKMYFAHDIGPAGSAMDTVMDAGVTLSFRGRLTVTEDWPLTPKGLEIRSSGKGMWGINQAKETPDQATPDNARGQRISFSLVTGTEHANLAGKSGLVMNRGGSADEFTPPAPTRSVDTDDPMPPETLRILEMPANTLTDWHEFWITIVADPKNGLSGGTHRVNIYLDGSLAPSTFWVNAGIGLNDYPSLGQGATIWRNYLGMGLCRGTQTGAFDTDFYSWMPGVVAPVPEPVTIGLFALGGLALLRRRR